jgi:hypothetical protein
MTICCRRSDERYRHVAIEIIRGSLHRHTSGLKTFHDLKLHKGRQGQLQAYLGASIGRVDSEDPTGSGTLGCFVRPKKMVKGVTSIKTCGLTKFHIAIPQDMYEPEKGQLPHVVQWMRHGTKPPLS